MRKALLVSVAVLSLGTTGASAQSLTQFFGTSNLTALAQSTTVLNLEAQSTAKAPQSDVNAFDDFFLINGVGKLAVNFDKALKSKGSVALAGWVGVSKYDNRTIKADLQAGWLAVKAKYTLQSGAAHVVVYKTLNAKPAVFVYDYAVEIAPGSQVCQEYLYLPASKGIELGMRTACYWTLEQFKANALGSAGKAK